jgi:hypothetical protein
MKRARRSLLALVSGALVLAACAREPVTSSPAPTASPTSPATPSPEASGPAVWIAVFETAEDPNDLDTAARTLMEETGTAVAVGPEICYGGLRGEDGVSPGEYVLVVVASSRKELEAAIERSGRDPVLMDKVEDLCPD